MDFTNFTDLAAERVGGKTLRANDEFFAPKENLIKLGRGVFIEDKFTSRGKWMDGWETRRRRAPGYDWCVLRLGLAGVVRGVDVDTNHFLGNFPESCSIDACAMDRESKPAFWKGAGPKWKEILPKTRLQGGIRNLLAVSDLGRWTHVRLNIYPDGGVARLRVHGEVRPNWLTLRNSKKPIDLAALANGAAVAACNDMFFGPKDNLIMPGRARNMGEGWETRRRRGPGHDWIAIEFGLPGRVQKLEIDTSHFKGNYPDACTVEGCDLRGRTFPEGTSAREMLSGPGIEWAEVLPRTKLRANARHLFDKELRIKTRAFTHLRLNIFPDGGVARFRAYGFPERWT